MTKTSRKRSPGSQRRRQAFRHATKIGVLALLSGFLVGPLAGIALGENPADRHSPAVEKTTFFRFTSEETSQIAGWPKGDKVAPELCLPDSKLAPDSKLTSEPEPNGRRVSQTTPIAVPPPSPTASSLSPAAGKIRTVSANLVPEKSGEKNRKEFSTETDRSLPVSPTVSAEKEGRRPEKLALADTGPTSEPQSKNPPLGSAETLEDAWQIALEASRQLQAKDYDYGSAESNVRAAVGVGLPKIANASGRHTVSEQYSVHGSVSVPLLGMSLPFETPISDTDFTTSVTTLTIPLYMGGRVRGMIEGAEAAAEAVAAGKQISWLDLKFEVAKTYFLVFRVRNLQEVAQEAEQTIAAHEKDARRLFENGLVTKNVVLSAQVALANIRQDVLKARNAVALSEAAYNRLLWRSLGAPVEITEMPIPPLSGEIEPLTAEALSRRPELTALTRKSQALAAEAKVHQADRLPQVALVGSHNYLENSHLNTDSSFSGSVGMVWMPIDGGVSRARQQASSYESMSIARQREDTETKISLQVYQCWLDEQESRSRIDVAQKAVEQAVENVRVVTRGFQEGITNHTEVLDATTMRTQAMTNLANAKFDAILSTYQLRHAVGNL